MTGFHSANRFDNLELISDRKQPRIQALTVKSPTPKAHLLLKGYDLETGEGKKSFPSQSQPPPQSPVLKLASRSRTATPASHPNTDVQMLFRWFLTHRYHHLGESACSCDYTNWQHNTRCEPGVSPRKLIFPTDKRPVRARHTLRCFVCSDYLRSRRFLHRQELKTFHN